MVQKSHAIAFLRRGGPCLLQACPSAPAARADGFQRQNAITEYTVAAPLDKKLSVLPDDKNGGQMVLRVQFLKAPTRRSSVLWAKKRRCCWLTCGINGAQLVPVAGRPRPESAEVTGPTNGNWQVTGAHAGSRWENRASRKIILQPGLSMT